MVWLFLLIVGMAMLVLILTGLVWLLLWLMPYYLIIGIVVLLIVRARRQRAVVADYLASEAQRQRHLNDQEFKAWQTAVEEERLKEARRMKRLRRLDDWRD